MDKTGIDLDYVTSNLNRSLTLIGSNLAIFTFMLIFLYPRYASNQLNGVLFQVSLTGSLLTIFLFGISGVHYFEVVAMAKASIETKMQLVRRGDLLFVVSLLLATAEPALILFTLGLTLVGVIATVLWTLYAVFLTRQGRKLRIG
ncbi:MAG: hypothetical protein AUF79_08510 [Crenarchaeota archaeon 13_1_20CM_2_51_8]|nr:MAG: hypothetical protein AUF79_08510 [Crenarchaeota archaeon 13_1_20CM_2_51_8]